MVTVVLKFMALIYTVIGAHHDQITQDPQLLGNSFIYSAPDTFPHSILPQWGPAIPFLGQKYFSIYTTLIKILHFSLRVPYLMEQSSTPHIFPELCLLAVSRGYVEAPPSGVQGFRGLF